MNFKNLLFFLLLSMIACKSDDNCNFSETLVPPPAFSLELIGSFEDSIDAEAQYFQMINNTVGYAYKSLVIGNDVSRYFLKTNDGGASWTSTPLSLSMGSATTMFFADENNGYIGHRGEDDKAYILKTTDAGLTWENFSFPEFPIHFRNMTKDADGNLYASLSGFAEYTGIVKSIDNGLSWEEIYVTNSPFIAHLTIVDDYIYFKESSDKLQKANLEGSILKTSFIDGNEQISVLDENNIIVVDQYRVNKTKDGGETWVKIFDYEARVVTFSAEDGLLLLLNKDYCGDILDERSSFGTASFDSFIIEEESEPMFSFEPYSLLTVQKIDEGHYLLQHGNEILEMKSL